MISEKKITCQIYQQRFYLEELTQTEWLISKKQKNGRVYDTNIEDKEHHFDYCFEFDINTKSRFVRISLIDYPNLKNFGFFKLQYIRKKTIKR